MGIGIAVLYRTGRGHWAWFLLAPKPFAACLWLGASPYWSVLVGLALALIILPMASLEAEGRFKVPALRTFLGAASYSIYFAHGLGISIVERLVRSSPYWIIAVVTAAGGLALGLGDFFIVERSVLRIAPGDKRHQRLTGEEPSLPTPSGAD